ncbi:hypothetical protein SDC9_110582 [bioreactor metagenome]|uniref:Uncharacterized protein n=1 Tax=bioreactor metagenome TaxID=1076179 RepID=A0A645BE24_9ZZZZ
MSPKEEKAGGERLTVEVGIAMQIILGQGIPKERILPFQFQGEVVDGTNEIIHTRPDFLIIRAVLGKIVALIAGKDGKRGFRSCVGNIIFIDAHLLKSHPTAVPPIIFNRAVLTETKQFQSLLLGFRDIFGYGSCSVSTKITVGMQVGFLLYIVLCVHGRFLASIDDI